MTVAQAHGLISVAPDLALLESVGKDICLRARVYPVGKNAEGVVLFATGEPSDELLREALQLRLDASIEFVLAEKRELDEHLSRLSGAKFDSQGGSLLTDLVKSEVDVLEGSSLEEIRRKSQAEPVIKLANNLVNQAIAEQATDIHIEPGENAVKVRYRKDGLLKDALELPKWVQASLVSRIKILAELDIAEKRLPQDGRIK